MKAVVLDQIHTSLEELSMDGKYDDDTLLLPVRYMKHLSMSDAEFEDQYMT